MLAPLGAKSTEVILDLRPLTFADSSAADTLGVAACRAVVDGQRLTVRASEYLRRVLILTGTAPLLTLEEETHTDRSLVCRPDSFPAAMTRRSRSWWTQVRLSLLPRCRIGWGGPGR